ncbi:hypothetical protein COCON_G00064050 [Conger conger]|uniref:Uncharacterized protein n=1 Tax=Conger conger TaxID=82655 RepID=A0A9Q1DS90_CONCO|nr:hypothetical protein COCON_G00064050 [Conger conger]
MQNHLQVAPHNLVHIRIIRRSISSPSEFRILSGLWEGQRCRRVLTGVLSREEEAENICLGDLSQLFGDNINIMADEQDLERKAVEELLREAARARIRAETIGPAGWARCPLRSTNKRFLLNTLRKTTLQQRTERAGSSRDGRQTTEPWFRRPQRPQSVYAAPSLGALDQPTLPEVPYEMPLIREDPEAPQLHHSQGPQPPIEQSHLRIAEE